MLAGTREQLQVRAAVVDVGDRARLAERGDDVVLGETLRRADHDRVDAVGEHPLGQRVGDVEVAPRRRTRRARCRAGRRRSRRWRGSSRRDGRGARATSACAGPTRARPVAPRRIGEGRELVSSGPLTTSFQAATRWKTIDRSNPKNGASGLNGTTGQKSLPPVCSSWWTSHTGARWSSSRTFIGMPGHWARTPASRQRRPKRSASSTSWSGSLKRVIICTVAGRCRATTSNSARYSASSAKYPGTGRSSRSLSKWLTDSPMAPAPRPASSRSAIRATSSGVAARSHASGPIT